MTPLSMLGLWQLMLIFLGLLFPLIALIDVLRSEFKGNNKLIWVIVIIFLSFFGALLYFLIGIRQKIKKTNTRPD